MTDNLGIVREAYALAEGDVNDMEGFVSLFGDDGYMWSVPVDKKYRGPAIGEVIGGMTKAFPDIHRELFNIYETGNVVVVELAIRGTHKGELTLPSGTLPPTGKTLDMPCCDVFHVENGKIASFHCYTMASIMMQQLGAAAD